MEAMKEIFLIMVKIKKPEKDTMPPTEVTRYK
jgi:hypothetical protein